MHKYGQYCPIAMAVEILGDRWTLLIVRDLLTGVSHFNELRRGLPGISRGLLAARLRRLEQAGIVTREDLGRGRKTNYRLTAAGADLQGIINELLVWGARWAFANPSEEQLDPLLLMWWMRSRINHDALPEARIVIQFDFMHKKRETYWLLLTREDASVCLTPPDFETDVIVSGHLALFFQLWLGHLDFGEALARGIIIDAAPALARTFPTWFALSLAAPAVRAAAAWHPQQR